MRLACCQIAPDVEDPVASAAGALAALDAAIAAGADVVVLPELASTGYCFRDATEARAAAEPVSGPTLRAWTASLSGSAAIVIGGFCELGDDGNVYNSAAIVDHSGVIAVYRKLHLWDNEKSLFTPGAAPAPVVETAHGRIGLCICYDIEFPELTRGLALDGAELIVAPANWPRTEPPGGERPMLMTLTMATAVLNGVHMVVCDRCGSERGFAFEGASAIADTGGWLAAHAPDDRTAAMLIVDCDLTQSRDKRTSPRNDLVADRRAEFYRPVAGR